MNIIYVTNARLPTEKAHGIATAKLCEQFADLGALVTIVAPRLWRRHGNYFGYYGVAQNVRIVRVPTVDLISLHFCEKASFFIQVMTFSFSALVYCAFRFGLSRAIFFSHDYQPLAFLTFLSRRIYYDIHHFPGENLLYRRLMKTARGFAVQTKWKGGELCARFDIPKERIVYWPNGTDTERFGNLSSMRDARNKLGIPLETRLILYVGSLHGWKGVETFLRAISFCDGVFFYSIGGSPEDIAHMKESVPEARHERVIMRPFIPPNEVPFWYAAADVLVIPNTGTQKVSLHYTSPMKLFEYMATGKPIVASRISAIEEIVDDTMVRFAEADNPRSFTDAIMYLLNNPDEAAALGRAAKNRARVFTWRARAEKITTHLARLFP